MKKNILKFSQTLLVALFLTACSAESSDDVVSKAELSTAEVSETKNSQSDASAGLVTDQKEFNEAVKNAQPGDTIVMQNGIWKNFEMVFDVVTCTESQLLDIRTMENEGLPKVNNKEIDVVKTMMQKIEKFGFKKDTDEIRKHLDLICPFRSKQSKDSIVRQIENLAALDTAVYEWNPSKAKRWSKDYSSIKYNFDGELTGNTHTFMCKQGSTYRTYHRMMSRYLDTGNPCQVLFHVSRPTKKSSIEAKRQRTMEDWNSGLKRLNDLGCRTDFMSVAGFLPQEKGKDNWSQLVKIK